ncbi:NLR family CARD domain-containing protein 3 [Oncorhynchus kisutch]|uniref:NLR family, CARD domain containing 3-like n=1 Tax=Oncorhynchus kisutch TaxID=8019 RepID=A0A8C7FQJ9_ONCKI|nr:NLR family CARD domain-containing protein 3-like [Oncorhynchus kisutch]
MDSDSEVERILQVSQNQERPPSSYGSMKSDEEEEDENITEAQCSSCKSELPTFTTHTWVQLNRNVSPETVFTEITQRQSVSEHPQEGTFVTERPHTRAEEEERDERSPIQVDYPEPLPPVKPEDESQEEGDEEQQPGKLHPEFDLPYIFKSMQNSLTSLGGPELHLFKRYLCGRHPSFTMTDLELSDTLDIVDKMLERFGKLQGLRVAIRMLESMKKPELAQELEKKCKRAVIQYELKCGLIRRHNCIFEGVPRAGQHLYLKYVYVEPQISTQGHGGVNPLHEVRSDPPNPPQVASPDSMIGGNNIFRLRSLNGSPVRCVLTTGLPGIGNSVAVQKFMLDWAEDRANFDIQFVFPFPFREMQSLRERNRVEKKDISMLELLQTYHNETRSMDFLEQPDCKVLFVMDGIDIYKNHLDFKNTPVVTDIKAVIPLDSLLVNLIRGSLLPHALLWLTGRRAATNQIPPEYIHRVTEIQGYSDEQKDDYLTLRYSDKSLAAKIIRHTKKSPTIYTLCHIPFCCWMVAMVYERGFHNYEDYGDEPPKITSFFIHYMIIQNNRKLEKYYGQNPNSQKWTDMDKVFMLNLGCLALKLLDNNRSVFYEEDLDEHSLLVREVAWCSGLCTELPRANAEDKRVFCFTHLSFLEFMAAHYVWLTFRLEERNILDQSHRVSKLFKEHSLVDMYRKAVDRYLSAPVGQYDLFLRFLCGLSMTLNDGLLRGMLFPHNAPPLKGLEEVVRMLTKRKDSAGPERQANLSECLRELETSKD